MVAARGRRQPPTRRKDQADQHSVLPMREPRQTPLAPPWHPRGTSLWPLSVAPFGDQRAVAVFMLEMPRHWPSGIRRSRNGQACAKILCSPSSRNTQPSRNTPNSACRRWYLAREVRRGEGCGVLACGCWGAHSSPLAYTLSEPATCWPGRARWGDGRGTRRAGFLSPGGDRDRPWWVYSAPASPFFSPQGCHFWAGGAYPHRAQSPTEGLGIGCTGTHGKLAPNCNSGPSDVAGLGSPRGGFSPAGVT